MMQKSSLSVPAASAKCISQNLLHNTSQESITYTNNFGIHTHYEPADFETRMAQRKCQMLQVIEKMRSKTDQIRLQNQILDFTPLLNQSKITNNMSELLHKHYNTSRTCMYRKIKQYLICIPPKHGTSNWQKFLMGGIYSNLKITIGNWKKILKPKSWQYKDLMKRTKQRGSYWGNIGLIYKLTKFFRVKKIFSKFHSVKN